MGRNSQAAKPSQERATLAAKAERHAAELSRKLGKGLKDARLAAKLTQAQAAARAGLSQSGWSRGASAADQPRDAVHVRNQELTIRTATAGAWRALPEEQIDREARTSRTADVLLHRRVRRDPADFVLMSARRRQSVCHRAHVR